MDNFRNKEWRKDKRLYLNQMQKHQNNMLDEMMFKDKLTIALPTGTGKSRIIYGDIIENVEDETFDVFTIVSHRLLLNTQHFADCLNVFKHVLNNVSFIFVGSGGFDHDAFAKNPEFNKILKEFGINYADVIFSSTNTKEITDRVKENQSKNKDTIIISTYHSLYKLRNINIHTIYCDEAHMLATNEELALFKDNFEQINAKRKYFFTATPKDSEEDIVNTFLMNNEKIFGPREGISFKESVKRGLIVKPYLHFIQPKSFNPTEDYGSIENYVKIIKDGFKVHAEKIKNDSFDSLKLSAKMLVKCPGVKEIWEIRERLLNDKEFMKDKIVCAGACWGPDDSSYKINDMGYNKTDFLRKMKEISSTDKAIILHYDVFTEGIDIPGITGVMFLSYHLPTKTKILQTIGRSTRLFPEDRINVHIESKYGIENKKKWIKPYCAVMLPIVDSNTQESVIKIAEITKNMRDNFEFLPGIVLTLGDDTGTGTIENNMDGINEIEGKSKKLFGTIEKVVHEIEDFDKIDKDLYLELNASNITNEIDNGKYVEKFKTFIT